MKKIEIIRSERRTLCVEIKNDLRVIVRAPLGMREGDIQRFIDEKSAWIEKHLKIAEERQQAALPELTDSEIKELADDARADILHRVAKYTELMDVTVGRITVKHQKTLWGSCSAKGNLNFNCLLMLCPEEIRDYVVVHELCHRIELNHSARFWAQVERILPDYEQRRKWLRENGAAVIGRIKQ